MATHTVSNQPPARTDIDEYALNLALREAVDRLAPDADHDELHRIGRLVGSAEFQRDAAHARGRVLIEGLAQLLQAAVLLTHAPAVVADAYVLARLGEDRGATYGALPEGIDLHLLVVRACNVQ